MVVHELSLAQCRDVLARTTLGRIACARADQPYVVPAFFYFDGEQNCLYSFATVGQKIDWMRPDDRTPRRSPVSSGRPPDSRPRSVANPGAHC